MHYKNDWPETDTPLVAESDFGRTRGFRLWEYGVGDEARCAAWVSLVRVAPGQFRVEGNVDVEITAGGQTRAIKADALAREKGVVIDAVR